MSDRHGAIRAFEWADPARRDGPSTHAVDAETYLIDLLASETGPAETNGPDDRSGRIGPTLAAAAAAIVLVGWLVTVLGDDRVSRVATDSITAPALAPPTAERWGVPIDRRLAAEQTPLIDPADATWLAISPWVTGDGTRGHYRSNSFHPELDFIVPDGWTRPVGTTEVPNALAPLARPGGPPAEGLYVAHHKDDATVVDWLKRMQDHPSITVGTIDSRALGAVSGIEVRFEVTGPMTYVNRTEHDRHLLEAGQAGVARVVQVDGHVVSALVIAATGPDLPAVEAAAEPILGSIHWRAHCDHGP